MKLYQFSCKEGKKIDLRQANAVLRHRPDVIIFEAPINSLSPSLIYNKYSPSRKPFREVEKHKKMLKSVAKKAPWVASDIYVYENIVSIWKAGHDVKLYNADAPQELLQVNLKIDDNWNPKPYRRGTHFQWWVRIYLREKIMAWHIAQIFSQYKNENPTILIFLQKFHWRNVQFLLSKPSKKQIYEYYFGKFKNLSMKTIGEVVKETDKTLYNFWKRESDFS